MAIQIGKYKRPGIFLEEFNNSVIQTTIVDGITNLVIGVSKKGPVNTPVLLTNVSDLETIYGQLDRGLERKGSFFHRTISKMLESSPVYAMNLLVTDDTLDVIEYKSLSTSSDYKNDIERVGPYRKFHDTTGFWKRDTDSFINLTKNNTGYDNRAFSLTNLSDRNATVFIFKTSITGFDRTLIDWYGAAEKVPPYVNINDLASDYMVDVVVVGGDWSNYKDLSIDPRWSAYFNSEGLRKDQVSNFANDRNVTTLSYYEGISLIPYFRDDNNRNIFIETVINRDTDKSGIFCAFNNDLVEVDYFNGKIDLIGNSIAGKNTSSIEFLSYKEKISEEVKFDKTLLDTVGNVTSLGTGTYSLSSRTALNSEGYVHNLNVSSTHSGSTVSVSYTSVDQSVNAYAIIGDQKLNLSNQTFTINANDYPISSTSATYSSAFVIDSIGDVKVINSSNSNLPTVSTSDIVLGYVSFVTSTAGATTSITNLIRTDVTVDTSGFVELDSNLNITESNGVVKIEFVGTNVISSVKDYEVYRRFKMFNRLVSLIDSSNKDKMTMLLNSSFDKVSLSGMTISDIETSTTSLKSFKLNTGLTSAELTAVKNGLLVFYTVDNEFILGSDKLTTKVEVLSATHGVVGEYSKFYKDFYDGIINTGDFFYKNKAGDSSYDVTFLPGETLTSISGLSTGLTSSSPNFVSGNDYIVFNDDLNINTGDVISIRGSILNTGTFTILGKSIIDSKYAFLVNENTVYENSTITPALATVNVINSIDEKIYLNMSVDTTNKLSVEFKDSNLTSSTPITVANFDTFYVQSANSNYKQTLEIELPDGYTEIPNKVLVNGARYTEVRVGDFLDAYYDSSLLVAGEVPRKLTRIITKKQYLSTDYVEIVCDSRISKSFSGTAYQTTRYKSVDTYASTYKAISLKGFRVRTSCLPDGTETKQNEILNLVSKGTPMFKSLVNKESFEFRYLVDSFGLGLTSRSKQQLVDICGERLDAFGFLNMPSMKSFKNSSSPSFVNKEGVLQLEFVSKGADPESGPSFLYSFGDGEGSTCVGYFTPYLTVNDNGRPLEMPPSSHAATTYMRKHNSGLGGITPWTIAAGVTNGRITNISGLEMDFTPTDIEWLNGAQMNPIVFKRNRGNIIETENTSQTLYKSALSFIHVREVLIELEKELSRMLLDFQWKANTSDIRAEIKLRADVICETYVNKNGLYNYFNKMDDENNTSEIIDNQIGVLDTYVEPIKGMGIIVNNVTILRTGAISAGGFQ